MAQVQQMLSSSVIRPSNSPWASPVVMVRKKTAACGFVLTFVNSTRPPSRMPTPLPRIDDLLDALHGLSGFPLWI